MEKFMALSEEKRTIIRNAALACFARHGYDKASMNDIAKAADVSKASMFQYFGSKQALYESPSRQYRNRRYVQGGPPNQPLGINLCTRREIAP